jgi:hypothetical protein
MDPQHREEHEKQANLHNSQRVQKLATIGAFSIGGSQRILSGEYPKRRAMFTHPDRLLSNRQIRWLAPPPAWFRLV